MSTYQFEDWNGDTINIESTDGIVLDIYIRGPYAELPIHQARELIAYLQEQVNKHD